MCGYRQSSLGELGLRIGIVARNVSREGSGVRRYITSIVNALLDIDDKNEYVIYYDKDSAPPGNPRATEKVIGAPARLLWDHLALPLATKRDNIDVLLCTRNVVPPLVRCKSVVTVHDLIHIRYPKYFGFKDSLYMNVGMRWSVRKSDAVIAVSQSTKSDLVQSLGAKPERVRCIYEAVDETYMPNKSAEALERTATRLRLPSEFILSVASIEPRKNLVRLVRAFTLLKQTTSLGHKLLLLGTMAGSRSPALAQLETEIQSSPVVDDIVRLHRVDEEDLPNIYNLASVLAYPSLYEGFGFPEAVSRFLAQLHE